jgi:hypothetical protein
MIFAFGLEREAWRWGGRGTMARASRMNARWVSFCCSVMISFDSSIMVDSVSGSNMMDELSGREVVVSEEGIVVESFGRLKRFSVAKFVIVVEIKVQDVRSLTSN